MSALVAAVALVAAGWLLAPVSGPRRLARLRPSVRVAVWSRLGVVVRPVLVAAAVLLGWVIGGGSGAAISWCAAVIAATVWHLGTRQRRDAAARTRATQVATACQLLAGLVRIGHVPTAALRLAAADAPVLAPADAVGGVGGSIPDALRRGGTEPGAGGLTQMALAWRVSERTGASLTATLDALGDRLDAEAKLRRVVSAELAAPRATARLLALLPLAGLGLGFAFGGDPLHFLLGTAVGQVALAAGVGLACLGLLWSEQVARRSEPSATGGG